MEQDYQSLDIAWRILTEQAERIERQREKEDKFKKEHPVKFFIIKLIERLKWLKIIPPIITFIAIFDLYLLCDNWGSAMINSGIWQSVLLGLTVCMVLVLSWVASFIWIIAAVDAIRYE